jgi:2-polyprenyl-6-methoxyphenol hydroxylase-like FAD-dependent oxidoreductase
MARIAIVGAGQGGLHLAIGLRQDGHDVTVLSNRTGQQIHDGFVTSSQSMYGMALGLERELGIDFWEHEEEVKYGAASMHVGDSAGNTMLYWEGRMDEPGQSIDQRIKMPRWMEHFEKIGGKLDYRDADIAILEELTAANDLVIVASGKGEIGQLFERNPDRSPYTQPQRVLALTYVKPMLPREGAQAISINVNPGIGEFVTFPGLTRSGKCDIFTIECVPGGPMDCWQDVKSAEDHRAMSEHLLRTYFPREAERIDGRLELTDDQAVLRGRVTPTVKQPVASLPSGRKVLGLGDVLVLNDPITGQGSNNASKGAQVYLEAIRANPQGPFDTEWMTGVFERFWDYARYAVQYTNMTLGQPPAHMMKILMAASQHPAVAHAMANSFNDPQSIAPWYFEPGAADQFLEQKMKEAA